MYPKKPDLVDPFGMPDLDEFFKENKSKIDKPKEERPVFGTCKVCQGTVQPKYITVHSNQIGSRSKPNRFIDSYFCKNCGIKYEFLPEKKHE